MKAKFLQQTISPPLHTSTWNVYGGTALIAFSMLALQIALTRLLSVISWYHLAFFAVSTAMLGMTAGATTVYLRPHWFTGARLKVNIAAACLSSAVAIPLSLVLLCLLPLVQTPSLMTVASLILATIACSLPYYCSGVAITAVLTKFQLPIARLYASDLIGASLGCLFVLLGLEILDAPSLILLCGAISAIAALFFIWNSGKMGLRRFTLWAVVSLFILSIGNSFSMYGIRPFVVKGHVESLSNRLIERWNSFSRVVVQKATKGSPGLWASSPVAPAQDSVIQHVMSIDGAAVTTVQRFSSLEDIAHLRYDLTNLAYYLRPHGSACIIGVGGGRDIQSALLFGHKRVIGIDVNPIFIKLLQREFREFAGIAGRNDVELHIDEARSFLSRKADRYSVIQMSLIDTWAATGAGAFSLTENALYTVEAWQVIISRLANDGIFTVSRWYDPENLGEMGRLVSLAVASLLKSGVSHPSQHIALATVGNLSTLLLSKQPFTEQDITTLKKVTDDLRYDLVISPDEIPHDATLGEIVTARSEEALRSAIRYKKLNYEPPTDQNPYFFNMLRLQHIGEAFRPASGVVRGNLIASITLGYLILSLVVVALATIVIPLRITTPISREGQHVLPIQFWSGALYFSLIGAGYMFVEIALIQRLSVFLGHPVYALGILLFTIILSSGTGSYLSEHLPLTSRPWLFGYPFLTALMIAAMPTVLTVMVSSMITSPIPFRIVSSIGMIFPLGMLLGIFFPTGMRLVKPVVASETPWYWALNGIFGVLSSALAVFFSIYFGISTNFYIAAACYTLLLVSLYGMKR